MAIVLSVGVSAQTRILDSLQLALKEATEDSVKITLLNKIAWELEEINEYVKSMEVATDLKLLSEKTGNKKGLSLAYSKMGLVYYGQGNYPRSLDLHLKSLRLCEETGDEMGMSVALNNIGNVYSSQGDELKALEYYKKDLRICEKLNDKEGMAVSYANIGAEYVELGDPEKGAAFEMKSMQIKQELGDRVGVGGSYLNMGNIYEAMDELDEALEYSFKALAILKESGSKTDVGIVYINLGSTYNKQGNYKMAIRYSLLGLEVSKSIGDLDNIRLCYENLSNAYAATGKYDEAYNAHVKFKQFTDSIFNESNSRQLYEVNTNYEVEKKEAELNAKAELEKERLKTIAGEENKRHLIIMISVIAILLIVVVFSVFLFKRFRITNKQKDIIEIQKHLVDEKQKEIIDSINYAKRIQSAILPAASLIKKQLPHSFIYYKPKDIVAGDFFWFETIEEKGLIFIAAADCTGHGVPGAMVSVVCSNALNRAVNEFRITEPGLILDKTRELVLETFEKSDESVHDGMDISLASIKRTLSGSVVLSWSGANNPLWYFKDGQLTIIKGDKQPIGKSDHRQNFETHTIELDKGDVFYLFTDGYADQFGGPKGKKFKHKQLEELCYSCFNLPPEKQSEVLAQRFDEWKGNLEQADDVTVIGVVI
jgi:serine phosphatase RsbU (regulator of sigma subunit)/tetratricopeptide (TPR) repeat protein